MVRKAGISGIFLHCMMGIICLAANESGCSGQQETELFSNSCDRVISIKDFTGLDGCGYLLEDKNVKLLLTANFDTKITGLPVGTFLYASWEAQDAMASICMKEDSIVTLNCLQNQGAKLDNEKACPEMIDPYKTEWAAEIMQSFEPQKVTEIANGDTKLYRFDKASGALIFDCSGTFLCFRIPPETDACDLNLGESEEKVIYVLDNDNG
jgi:hypothetical protein